MNAILEAPEMDQPPKGKVSRSARKRYEQSVFDNVCDPAILFDGRKLKIEWERDRQTYEARAKACESLKTGVPRLEEAAVEAAKRLTDAQTFATLPLADGVTTRELRQTLQAAGFAGPTGTPAELAIALQWFANVMPDGHLGRLKSSVLRSRSAVDDARRRAEEVLYRTSGDNRPDSTLTGLSHQIEEIQRRIRERRPALEVCQRQITEQEQECERISRGEVSPPVTPGALTTDGKIGWIRAAYREARQRLDELFGLLGDKADAVAANERDQAALAKLQAKVQAAHEARLARVSEPTAMRWCGDE